MKDPYVLVASARPEALGAVLRDLSAKGYVTETIHRASLLRHLRQLCFSPASDVPDLILLAPEAESVPWNVGGWLDAWDIVANVRELPDAASLPGGVRAKVLPIVLAAYGRDRRFYDQDRPRIAHRWFRDVRRHSLLIPTVADTIRDWRRDLLEHLNYKGFAITRDERGRYHVGHALQRLPRESDMLAADASPSSVVAAQWYIVPSDVIDRDLPGLFELEDLLNTYMERASLRHIKPETIFQEFFDHPAHAHMLYRGLFAENHRKVMIPKDDGWDQPDYVQRPRPLSPLRHSGGVLDLKLPDVSLVKKTSRRDFSAKVHEAVAQLRDYRRRIDEREPAVLEAFRRQIGWIPRQPRLAVVIGIREREDPDALRHREETILRDLEVDLVTYDDVLNREARRILLQLSLSPPE